MLSMKKKNKKKEPNFLNILFKVLSFIVLIIFTFIIYTKSGLSTQFSGGSTKSKKPSHAPSKLTWFDHFKGIENVPNKDSSKPSSHKGLTGFNYQGFKK